jgi:hypothetical protein
MMSFFRGEPDAILPHSRSLLFGSFVVILLSGLTNGAGIITAVFALGLGASGAVFSSWRTERGLWMLAIIFFLMNSLTYAFMIVGQWRDAMNRAPADSIVLWIDLAAGTALLSVTLRFLVRVIKENFALSYAHREK